MNFINVVLFAGIFSVMVACNNNSKQKQTGVQLTKDSTLITNSVKKGLEVEPLFKRADSLQILYYDNPDGDSLRYTRFYRYAITKDSATINDLLANLSLPVEQRNGVKNCRSEGKIYVFSKQEAIKTVYFSTRCDSCCYVYFIKEGAFFYSRLSDNLKDQLTKNKNLSRRP